MPYSYEIEEYYEPNEFEKVLFGFQEEMKKILLGSVKNEIDQLREQNLVLKEENEEYSRREQRMRLKENELKNKEESLKREVENEFYRKTIEEALERYVRESEVWIATLTYFPQEKCEICDENRKVTGVYPDGVVLTKSCLCTQSLRKYVPKVSVMNEITIGKTIAKYNSERKFYLKSKYTPTSDRDDYPYRDFKVINVVNMFDKKTKKLHDEKRYAEEIGFMSESECQKYCNWLNKRKGKG